MPLADATLLQDPDRLAKLRALNLLDSETEAAFDRLTRLASRLLNAPVALVSLVDANRQFFKSQLGLAEPYATARQTPLSHSFCQHPVATHQPLIVENAPDHPLVHDNLAIRDLNIIAYAGIPLITSDGYTLGSFCVIDTQPRAWTPDEISILSDLAAAVMTEIELRAEIFEHAKSAAELSTAQLELTRERNLLRTILDTLPESIFVKDSQGRYVLVNQSHSQLMGRPPEALIGKDTRELYGDLGELYYRDDMEILHTGRPLLNYEEPYASADHPASARWHLVSKLPFRNEAGEINGLLCVITDITDRKRAEVELKAMQEALTHERNLLRQLIDTLPNGVFIKDTEGRYLILNSYHANLSGRPIEELLGKTTLEIYPDRGQIYYEDDMRVIQTGVPVLAREEPLIYPKKITQTHGWCLTSKIAVYDAAGQVMGLVGIQTDISERKWAEAALRESQQQLQAAVTNVPIILFCLDKNGVFTLQEGSALSSVGLKPGQFVGQSFFELYEHMPERIERAHAALAGEIVTSLIQEGDYYFEVRYSPLLDTAGELNGTIGILMDVTERISAQEALQANVDQLKTLRRIEAELNATLAVDQVLMFALDVAVRLTGAEAGFVGLLENDSLVIAKKVGPYQEKQAYPLDHGIVKRVRQTRRAEWIQDVSQDPDYSPDIPTTRAQMCFPLIYHDELTGILNLETPHPEFFDEPTFQFLKLITGRLTVALENAQFYEISQRQVAELQELYARVSYLERLKTDMIRIAAHDLRNPLTGIMGLTELLLEQKDTLMPEQVEFLHDIEAAARQMYKMTGDVLSIQRIEESAAGMQSFDFTALVQTIYDHTRPRANRKKQTFELRIPAEPINVKGDAVQLREAVENLVGNAIKYTPDGGKISVRLAQNGDGHLLFEVEDTGYGIPENQQTRLFQPFFRAKTAETRQIEGTGLGLHLVKNIIERHQGQMHLRSVYGKGSTFGFTLKSVN